MTNSCSRWWFALNVVLISMIPCWGLKGNLHLSCNASTIGVQVSFSQVLSGVLYAKGHLHEEHCRMFFMDSKAFLGLSNRTCGSTVAEIHGKPFLRNVIVIRGASKMPTTAHVEEIFCGLNRVENHTFEFSIDDNATQDNFKTLQEKTVQKRTSDNRFKSRVQALSNHFLNYKQQMNEQRSKENLMKRTLSAKTLKNHTETINFTTNTRNLPTEFSVKDLIVSVTTAPYELQDEISSFNNKLLMTETDPFADVGIATTIDKDYFTSNSLVNNTVRNSSIIDYNGFTDNTFIDDNTFTTYSLMNGNMTSYAQTDASAFIEEMNDESEIKIHMEKMLNASSGRFSRLEAEYNIGFLSHSDIQLALDTSNLENYTNKVDENVEINNEKSHAKSNIGVLLFSEFLTTNIPLVPTEISTHLFIPSSEPSTSTTEINLSTTLSVTNDSSTLIVLNSTEIMDDNLRVVNDFNNEVTRTVSSIENSTKEKDMEDDSNTLIMMNSTEGIDDNLCVVNESGKDIIKYVNSIGNTTKEKDMEDDNLNKKIDPSSKLCVQRFVFIAVSLSLSFTILILISVCVGLLLYTKKLKKKHDLDSYLLYSFY